jgi:WD40 repeat protein
VEKFLKAINTQGVRQSSEIQSYKNVEVGSDGGGSGSGEQGEVKGSGTDQLKTFLHSVSTTGQHDLVNHVVGKVLELKKLIDFGVSAEPQELTSVRLQRLFGIDVQHKSFSFRAHSDRRNTAKSDKFVYFCGQVVVVFFYKQGIQEFFFGHQHPITALTLSTNGLMASADFNQVAVVLVWDLTTREVLRVLTRLHYLPVAILQFFGANRYLLLCSFSTKCHVLVYDLKRSCVALSYFELESILEVSDPDFAGASSKRAQMVCVTEGQVIVLSSPESEDRFRFTRERCLLKKARTLAPICSFVTDRNDDQSLRLILGHRNGAVTVWRNFDFVHTLAVYDGPIRHLVSIEGVGLVVNFKETGFAMWNVGLDKQFRLLDAENLKLLRLPFTSVSLCQGFGCRLVLVTDSKEVLQLKFASRSPFAGKKRIRRLQPIVCPLTTGFEFFVKSRNQSTMLVFAADTRTLLVYNLDDNDYAACFHFAGTSILGFDVLSASNETRVVVATANGCLHFIRNEELLDQLQCFDPSTLVRVRMTANPDMFVLLSRDNRLEFFATEFNRISCKPPTKLTLEEKYLQLYDMRYLKKSQKLLLFSNKNLTFKVEDLKGRIRIAPIDENEMVLQKLAFDYFDSPTSIQKCLLMRKGQVFFCARNEVHLMLNEEELDRGDFVKVSFSQSHLTHMVFRSRKESLFVSNDSSIMQATVACTALGFEAFSEALEEVTSCNPLLSEELSRPARLSRQLPPKREWDYQDSYVYGRLDSQKGVLAKNLKVRIPEWQVKAYKRQNLDQESFAAYGRRAPMLCLRLQHIYGFQGLCFRNNLAYTHLYKSHFTQEIDTVISHKSAQVQSVEVKRRFLEECLVSPHKYYPYDRQHKACRKEIAYFVSKYGVVMDGKGKAQRFYTGHQSPINAMAVSSSKCLVATGDLTRDNGCSVHVWSSCDLSGQSQFDCPEFNCCVLLRFSNFDEFLVCVGLRTANSTYCLSVFDVVNRLPLSSTNLSQSPVLDLQFNNYLSKEFTVAGMNLIEKYLIDGCRVHKVGQVRVREREEEEEPGEESGDRQGSCASRPLPPNAPRQPHLCITVCQYFYYLLGEKLDADYVVGTASGDLGIVAFGSLKLVHKGHDGQINAIRVTDVMHSVVVVISAGEDGMLRFWNTKFELINQLDMREQSCNIEVYRTSARGADQFNYSVQSMDVFACDTDFSSASMSEQKNPEGLPKVLLVGTRNSEVIEIGLSTEFLGITTRQTGTLLLNKQVLRPEEQDSDVQVFDLKRRERIVFDLSLVMRFNANGLSVDQDMLRGHSEESHAGEFVHPGATDNRHLILRNLELSKRQLKFEVFPDCGICLSYGANEDLLFWNTATHRLEDRFLVSPFPVAVCQLLQARKLVLLLNDNSLVLFGYDCSQAQPGGDSCQRTFRVNRDHKKVISIDEEDLFFTAASVFSTDSQETQSLAEVGCLSASPLKELPSDVEEASFEEERFVGFDLFLHRVLVIDSSKYDQAEVLLATRVQLKVAKGRDEKVNDSQVVGQTELRLKYQKDHSFFESQQNTVCVYQLDRVISRESGLYLLHVRKSVRRLTLSADSEVFFLLRADLRNGKGGLETVYLDLVEQSDMVLKDLLVLRKTLFAQQVPKECPMRVTEMVAYKDNYLIGTDEGELLLSRLMVPYELERSDWTKVDPSSGKNSALPSECLPNQMRVVAGHSTPVSKVFASPKSRTVMTCSANENCVFQWEILELKPFFDLDGLFHNVRLTTSEYQSPMTPRELERLLQESKRVETETVHLKEQMTGKAKVSLSLEKVVGRHSVAARNNLFLSYDNKIVFCVGSLICMMPAAQGHGRQEFLMREDQMSPSFVAHAISSFALSSDGRFVVVGTSGDPATVFFWELCSKVCYFTLPLAGMVQVLQTGFSMDDSLVLLGCLSAKYTHTLFVLSNESRSFPRVVASCELRYSPVFKVHTFAFHPQRLNEFVTAGEQHLTRWRLEGGRLNFQELELEVNAEFSQNGNYHKTRHDRLVLEQGYVDPMQIQQVFLTVCFVENDLMITGSADGSLYFWHCYCLIMVETGHPGAAVICSATSKFHQSDLTRPVLDRGFRRRGQPVQDQKRQGLQRLHSGKTVRLQVVRERPGPARAESDPHRRPHRSGVSERGHLPPRSGQGQLH